MRRPITDAHRRLIQFLVENALTETGEHMGSRKTATARPTPSADEREDHELPAEHPTDGALRIRIR